MSLHEPANTNLQQIAYKTLVDIFIRHEDNVIEIEVLPPAIQPPDGIVLQEDLNLGIPKKILALAFLEARQRFFDNLTSKSISDVALQATKVILLFDPEHITAANLRKRRLLALKKEASEYRTTTYQIVLKQELCFLNTILTSPLHRQSKSPTLWYHRLWTVKLIMDAELKNATKEQKRVFWQGEIDAVCKSGEQHPKNYYAWQYLRKLFPIIDDTYMTDKYAHHVKEWCFKHPSDISGWSFLLFLLPEVLSLPKRQMIIRDVFKYAINLRAEQESLWVFIRMVLSQDRYGDHVENYQTLRDHSHETDKIAKQSALSQRISQTLHWTAKFGEPFVEDKITSSN